MEKSIFIQIASYRDSELKKTIKDCLEKARFPENLVFSICWQHALEDQWDDLNEFQGDPRFKIIDVDYRQSNGVCWARNLLQKQYNGETYTLQLDSHHRFVQGWDEYLINTHSLLQAKGFKKPLITGYIPGYDPITDTYINPGEVWTLKFNRFSPEGILHLNPETEPNPERLTMPIRARLYSAHFAFASGDFVREVPHDPELYFHGEEPSIGIRAFTHGYDLFHPHRCFVYHFYERKGFKRHWDDQGGRYDALNNRAHERFRKLLGVRCEPEDLGIYGLGKVRSLEEYERYAGIRFRDCRIQQYTLKNYPPPNPKFAIKEDYDKSFLSFYKHCIDIRYDQVLEPDYEFWVVAFHDKDGADVFRQDAPKSEIDRMFADPDKYCKIWREFFYDREPVKWIVWPFSTKKGWSDRIEGRLDLVKEGVPSISASLASEYKRQNGEIFKFYLKHEEGNTAYYINKKTDNEYTILYAGEICESVFKDDKWVDECSPVEFWCADFIRLAITDYPITDAMKQSGVLVIGNLVFSPKQASIDGAVGIDDNWFERMNLHERAKRDDAERKRVEAEKRPDMREMYMNALKTPYQQTKAIATIDDVDKEIVSKTSSETILVHLPAYREPELIPTILDALGKATNPDRVHFGICRQYNPADGFDNLDEFKDDPRFKIMDVHYEDAKGLPWARAQINESLLTDEDYVLQLDAHHRFVKDWDSIMIGMLNGLERDGVAKPIITGYTPQYSPFNDPGGRVMEPWMSGFRCFYPLGTIFIGPQLLHGWEEMTGPARSRFLCGHFDFARSQWARDVRHDPTILFAGEEINLTVRSFTHGYDFYHPHRIVLWHGTMREERSQICKWDDDGKKGIYWDEKQNMNRRMIMKLFGVEEHPDIELNPNCGLGTERTVREYEIFAGLDFKNRRVQKYTEENQYPPNPIPLDYDKSFMPSFYYLVNIYKKDFPRNDYRHILVAFDDEDGIGVNSEFVQPNFQNGVIHYAKYFTYDRPIDRVVYWGQTHSGEWVERVETSLDDMVVRPKNGLLIENASAEDVAIGNHFDPGENSVLIQILDPGYDFPNPKHTFAQVYKFSFCDWQKMSPPYSGAEKHELIQESHASEIADALLEAIDKKMNVIVHCFMGRSRSAGVCEAAKALGFEVVKNQKDYVPNRKVEKMIKRAVLSKGK